MMSPVVGYYGKLPHSPEFLRLHAAGPELRWLDDWLQRGVLYAKSKEGAQWPALIAQSDLWNFLYVPSGHGRIVCGVVFASQDKAGRSFPFLTFQIIDRDPLSRNPWLVPLVAAEFLEAATKLLQQLRQNLDWGGFCRSVETVSGTRIDMESLTAEFGQYMRTITAKEWWTGLWGEFDDPRKYQVKHGLGTLIRSSQSCVDREIPWGIRCPLFATTTAETYDLPFWLKVIMQSVRQGQQRDPGMFVFWNRSPTTIEPCALVSIGPGSPNMIRFLLSPKAQDDSWRDVVSGNHIPAGLGETGAHDEDRVLNDPVLSLDRLFEYFCGIG